MMTLPEAARSLGVAESTLRLQAKLGKFRATKIARDWLVPAEEVERYRRENQRKDGDR
jgi:excisionase family DNA binding protein